MNTPMHATDEQIDELVAEEGVRRPVYFCAGRFCPGLHWPASNAAHPTSCSIEGLNSPVGLRAVATLRRQHGRDVSFVVPAVGP